MECSRPSQQIAYRAFTVSETGRLVGVPEIIRAADDGDALQQVERRFCFQSVELWEGPRLVARLPITAAASGAATPLPG